MTCISLFGKNSFKQIEFDDYEGSESCLKNNKITSVDKNKQVKIKNVILVIWEIEQYSGTEIE